MLSDNFVAGPEAETGIGGFLGAEEGFKSMDAGGGAHSRDGIGQVRVSPGRPMLLRMRKVRSRRTDWPVRSGIPNIPVLVLHEDAAVIAEAVRPAMPYG
jgi:hypothetical protein